MMMFFSERKKLAEEYEKWVSENKDVLDCPLTVISWLVAEGYVGKTKVADLEAKLAERCKEIAIRNKKLNELKNELHKRNESLERKKQQVEDVHKAVKQAKRESARKGRQVCYANNEVVQYQKQIRLLKQQLAEWERDSNATLNEYRAIKYENKQLNKALELACNKIGDMFGSNYQEAWFYSDDNKTIVERDKFEEYFKTKAKEMMSENGTKV